ncbi:hypothetical protein [Nonomuraea sp. B19D2]|uniref:hypothetical protein n=1 Tax=Nonomuraea sp. B19D2 TaxID=3159561 RepID=UPI0032DA6EA7
MFRSVIKVVARLSVLLPVSVAFVAGPSAMASSADVPPNCSVSVKTIQGHEVGMRTIVGRGVVKCSSALRPQISINLRKGDTIKSRARKDCKQEKKCVAYTDTVFRAEGSNWCTQMVVNWGLMETIKWGCL